MRFFEYDILLMMNFLKHIGLVLGLLTVQTIIAHHGHDIFEDHHHEQPAEEHGSDQDCSICLHLETSETGSTPELVAHHEQGIQNPEWPNDFQSGSKFEPHFVPSRAPPKQ